MVKHKVATRATSLSAQGLRSVARHVGGLRVRQPLHTRFALSPPDDINTAAGRPARDLRGLASRIPHGPRRRGILSPCKQPRRAHRQAPPTARTETTMNINHAILHVFDFEGAGTTYSARELDLGERLVK